MTVQSQFKTKGIVIILNNEILATVFTTLNIRIPHMVSSHDISYEFRDSEMRITLFNTTTDEKGKNTLFFNLVFHIIQCRLPCLSMLTKTLKIHVYSISVDSRVSAMMTGSPSSPFRFLDTHRPPVPRSFNCGSRSSAMINVCH